MSKATPDINDTLNTEGADGVRRRHDKARRYNGAAADKPQSADDISPTPFVWSDSATLPRRLWLYGGHYVRRFVTCTVGTSGHGKTTIAIAEALVMASGRPLLGIEPEERINVWYWNGEDPREEVIRRVQATMLHYGVPPEEVEGRLFVNGRETKIVVAEPTRGGIAVARPVIDKLSKVVKTNGIGVITVDPLIKTHRCLENDNTAIDIVASEWSSVADATGAAIELLHHSRKGAAIGRNGDITVDDARGAGSLISATRSARVLNRMTKEDAENLGIPEETVWRYLRLDNGKASMAPPPDKAAWFHLIGIELGNGDNVGVAACWDRRQPFDGLKTADLRAAQAAVAAGGPWREDCRAADWVGRPIAEALQLDIGEPATRRRIGKLLKTWIANNAFVVVEHDDEHRHKKTFVEVGQWAN